jgi:hypothetical protein
MARAEACRGCRSDAKRYVKGRKVRKFLDIAVRQNGTFGLCKSKRKKEKIGSGQDFEIWLPKYDSNTIFGTTVRGPNHQKITATAVVDLPAIPARARM